jgi:hypothetical protein
VALIDWSNKEMYDKSSQGVLFSAFKAARGDVTISEDEMTLYHDCWYWGCDSVCNDRYTINRILAFASCVASVMYLALATLSGVQSGFDSDYKDVPTEEPVTKPVTKPVTNPVTKPVNESIPMVDAVPVFKLDELLKKPDPSDIEAQTPSKASSSGDESNGASVPKGWKFRLRM